MSSFVQSFKLPYQQFRFHLHFRFECPRSLHFQSKRPSQTSETALPSERKTSMAYRIPVQTVRWSVVNLLCMGVMWRQVPSYMFMGFGYPNDHNVVYYTITMSEPVHFIIYCITTIQWTQFTAYSWVQFTAYSCAQYTACFYIQVYTGLFCVQYVQVNDLIKYYNSA